MPLISKKSPFLPQKCYPRDCWVVYIILQFQRATIENASINMIDTINAVDKIDGIYCIDQYKYNQYNLYCWLKLQTSPTQLNHWYLIFDFLIY